MVKKITTLILILFFFPIYSKLIPNENKIIVKVGNEIITSYDLENEIRTNLVFQKLDITQDNIDKFKNQAIKNLINRKIKSKEVKKYKIEEYDKTQYNAYLENLDKTLTNNLGLRSYFKNYNLNYDVFLNSVIVELKWNRLILQLYKNQVKINPQEVENELNSLLKSYQSKKRYELSEIQLSKQEFSSEKYLEVSNFIKKNGFKEAAKTYSISETKKNDGKLGIFDEDQLNEKVFNLVSKLNEGSFTEPIEIDEYVNIFYLERIIVTEESLDLESEKEKIINKKKEEKLKLFSSSHFANLESSLKISFL